jgi:hypothetical protein
MAKKSYKKQSKKRHSNKRSLRRSHGKKKSTKLSKRKSSGKKRSWRRSPRHYIAKRENTMYEGEICYDQDDKEVPCDEDDEIFDEVDEIVD